jgi:hypothetical protein
LLDVCDAHGESERSCVVAVVDGRGKEEDEIGCGCWSADCIEKISRERRKKKGASACCVACWLEKERETQMVLVCLSIGEGKGWSCC